MLGFNRTLGCDYGAIFDAGEDDWIAYKVYRDGNRIDLGHFATEFEAECVAEAELQSDLEANSQFGVGA